MNKLQLGLYFLFIWLSIALTVEFLENSWGISKWVITLVGYLLGIWLLFYSPILFLRIKCTNKLKRLSLEALKKQVFRYEKEYFKYIGEEDSSVVRFRDLIECENIETLIKEWPAMSARFRKLEITVGHKGRPLIMDYYQWYELDLSELSKRFKNEVRIEGRK